jgi:hypothetical protein
VRAGGQAAAQDAGAKGAIDLPFQIARCAIEHQPGSGFLAHRAIKLD